MLSEDMLTDLDAVAPAVPGDRFREAARALADLRRGRAVVLREAGAALGCAAAETVRETGLTELRHWSALAPLLLVPVGVPVGAPVGAPVTEGGLAPEFRVRVLGAAVDAAGLRRLIEPGAAPGEAAVPPGAAAAVALARLARLLPALVLTPLDAAGVVRAQGQGAVLVEAADVAALGRASQAVERVGDASVPLQAAPDSRVVVFRNPPTGVEHVAVIVGRPEAVPDAAPAPLLRLHSECFTGDVLGSLRCDCGPQLTQALSRMAEAGAGIVLYLAQEGRGIGLLNKLRSYRLQDRGLDTLDANLALGYGPDEREFGLAASMLRELGVGRVRLLSNNPEKAAALAANGVAVERVSLLVAANGVNDTYLSTKASRFGHLLG